MFFKNKGYGKNILLFLFLVFLVFQLGNFSKTVFYGYDTPEAVIQSNFKDKEATLSLIGEETACVVCEDDNSSEIFIVEKTDNGWKNATNIKTRRAFHSVKDNFIISAYTYKNTQDFYIRICTMDKEKMNLSDNKNSEFIEHKNSDDKHVYYTYIKNLDETYQLFADGKKVDIAEALKNK